MHLVLINRLKKDVRKMLLLGVLEVLFLEYACVIHKIV